MAWKRHINSFIVAFLLFCICLFVQYICYKFISEEEKRFRSIFTSDVIGLRTI